jgi:hypothetical protein
MKSDAIHHTQITKTREAWRIAVKLASKKLVLFMIVKVSWLLCPAVRLWSRASKNGQNSSIFLPGIWASPPDSRSGLGHPSLS